MDRARSRAVAALPLAIALGVGSACGRPRPTVPDGVTVIREAWTPPRELVAEVQRLLQRRGTYVGEVDGQLSPATRVALAKLQRERGLVATGELDVATLEALGLARPLRRVRPLPRAEELPETRPGPTRAPPLEAPPVPERPQPPPGALEEAREEARQLLARGAAAAAPLPAPEELRTGPLAPAVRELERAGAALFEARAMAFERLLRAREAGGWALLPPESIEALEEALARRSLLVQGPDGRLGADDEAAIRWVEGSLGLPPSGRPGLRLLEALGIDPSPMFAP